MKNEKQMGKHPIITNLSKLMKDKNIKQETIANYAEIAPSQMSRVLSGNTQLGLWQLSNIATNLNMQEIDFFTYPDIYEKKENAENSNNFLLEIELTDEELREFTLKNKIKKILKK